MRLDIELGDMEAVSERYIKLASHVAVFAR